MSLLLFASILSQISARVAPDFDPKAVDYCQIVCFDGSVSTACNCYQRGNRTEELDDLVDFRTEMLFIHNVLRNRLAGGLVGEYKKATNMRAFSYSLELEYMVRCYVLNYYVDYHDKCRDTPQWQHVGQNMAMTHAPHSYAYVYPYYWFDEWKYYRPELIAAVPRMNGTYSLKVGHFIQMAWAEDYLVGCARGWKADNVDPISRWMVACDYAGSNTSSGGTFRVYKEGETPCSECLGGLKCNKDFPNLCGEIDPVPTDGPVPIPSSEEFNATDDDSNNSTNSTNSTNLKSDVARTVHWVSIVTCFILYVAVFALFSE